MHLDFDRSRTLLKSFDFQALFIEELGLDHHEARLEITLSGRKLPEDHKGHRAEK